MPQRCEWIDCWQAMLRTLEEDTRLAAQKPRVMKKFHETRKAEKFQTNTKSDKKLAPPTVEVEPEEEEDEGIEDLPVVEEVENGGSSVSASPRNKTLNKLGTRGRGGAKPKKTTSTTSSVKKPKE